MKAFVCNQYQSFDEMSISDIQIPQPEKDEVIVKVHFTTINDFDWSMVQGYPKLYRLLFGLRKPKNPIPGMELSGTVHAVGSEVEKFRAGDEVFGDISGTGWGTFAEFARIKQESLELKPDFISMEDAACLPHAGLLAYQGLVELGKIKEGDKVLINGAGGGVGTLAIGIAKQYGCHVTGVDSEEKLSMLVTKGYDDVLDYKTTDYTMTGDQYDLILDTKTGRLPQEIRRALKDNGRYVTVGGTTMKLIQAASQSIIMNRVSGKQILVLGLKPNRGIGNLLKMYLEKQIKPKIDGPYPFEEIPELLKYFGEGKHQGKVLIKVGD